MRDTKKEVVLKNLHKLLSLVEGYSEYEDCVGYAIEALEQEPKIGHWILGGYDDNYYICDKCNYKASEYYFKPRYNFCPNCGCRMVESQESEAE